MYLSEGSLPEPKIGLLPRCHSYRKGHVAPCSVTVSSPTGALEIKVSMSIGRPVWG